MCNEFFRDTGSPDDIRGYQVLARLLISSMRKVCETGVLIFPEHC